MGLVIELINMRNGRFTRFGPFARIVAKEGWLRVSSSAQGELRRLAFYAPRQDDVGGYWEFKTFPGDLEGVASPSIEIKFEEALPT